MVIKYAAWVECWTHFSRSQISKLVSRLVIGDVDQY